MMDPPNHNTFCMTSSKWQVTSTGRFHSVGVHRSS